jgi:hypothetical protein
MPSEFASRDHVRAVIAEAIVERRCGAHPWEKHAERLNRLMITVEMLARLPSGPMRSAFIDYDRIRDFLTTLPSLPHTDLLETIVDCAENCRLFCENSVRPRFTIMLPIGKIGLSTRSWRNVSRTSASRPAACRCSNPTFSTKRPAPASRCSAPRPAGRVDGIPEMALVGLGGKVNRTNLNPAVGRRFHLLADRQQRHRRCQG